jgi:hypothetical protein
VSLECPHGSGDQEGSARSVRSGLGIVQTPTHQVILLCELVVRILRSEECLVKEHGVQEQDRWFRFIKDAAFGREDIVEKAEVFVESQEGHGCVISRVVTAVC